MTVSNNRPEKRTREITIRVTDNELERLYERKTDATLAGWLRNLGLGATPIRQADPNLVRALVRIMPLKDYPKRNTMTLFHLISCFS